MKKIALSVAALALTAGSALAADLPSRKGPPVLPPPPPPPMWTGFYVGLNAGYTWANNTTSTYQGFGIPTGPGAALAQIALESGASASGVFGNGASSGFIGGGQIGYNWQFYNSFVVGVEADIQGIAGSSGSTAFTGAVPSAVFAGSSWLTQGTVNTSLDYIGTVRGRLGWLFTPTLLVYGTGGLAYGGVTTNTSYLTALWVAGNPFFPGATGSAFADTRVGWTAGGGIEWMFWPNWSAKVEYLYYDLGTVTSTGFNVDTVVPLWSYAAQSTTRFDGNIVRAGLNYHFNWGAPAPVVAKY